MSEDPLVANLTRRSWLMDSPLEVVVSPFVGYLRVQRYVDCSIRISLESLAHFAYWTKLEGCRLANVDKALVDRFLHAHLPSCKCPAPCWHDVTRLRHALTRLLVVLRQEGLLCAPPAETPTPVAVELDQFRHYLLDTCGLAQSTIQQRMRYTHEFLLRHFGSGTVDISWLTAQDVDNYVTDVAKRWAPVSLGAIRTCLSSYVRFRALRGDQTQCLKAALPVIATRAQATLPKELTDAQVESLLQTFDRTDPMGQRDYAIARCLIDLGLRGGEVAHLRLESLDWREGTITIDRNKERRARQLPLPVQTGEAITQYLRHGRPTTSNRQLFVRHKAPVDKPIGVSALRAVINAAYVRCGLGDQFGGTHALRHTNAMRLQRSGASLKEIADVLGHQCLQVTMIYAKCDLERLRAVALPWPGSPS